MITVASIDDLPDSVPELVTDVLALTKEVHDRADADDKWGAQPAFLVNYKVNDGKLGVGVQVLGTPDNSGHRVLTVNEELLSQIYGGDIVPTSGKHVATAVFSESMAFRDAARGRALAKQWTTLRGRALDRAIATAVRKRKVIQERVTFIAFSDGWKCQYVCQRNVAEPTINVYEPSDTPELGDTFNLVITLDEKLSTRDLRDWLPGPPPRRLRVHVSDLIAAYTGLNCTMGGSLAGIWRMAEYMVNRELPEVRTDEGKVVFQLGRAVRTARPTLAAEFPWLDDVAVPNFGDLKSAQRSETLRVWLDKIIAEHGSIQEVPRLPEGLWEDKDPVAELREMARDGATIVAAMPLNGIWETFTNPVPGMFHNPRLDEDGVQ